MTPARALLPEPLLTQSLPIVPGTPEAPAKAVPEPVATASLETTAELTAESVSPPVEPAPEPEPTLAPVPPATVKQPLIKTPPVETKVVESKPVEPIAVQPKPVAAKPAEKPAAAIEQKTVSVKPVKSETDNGDLDWIMAQPADSYTVQIMVLSSKASVNRFLRKYADYGDDLKYYSIGKEGQEKYVLIYGSFPSSTDALNHKSNMPDDFNRGLVKRFKYVQRESRRK
jgi:DamX protein